jgi:atypical dual specificity phosphatase
MLRNFTRINDWLFTSGRPSPEDLDFLCSNKISAVVSLTETPLFFLPDAIRYLHIPIPDFSIPTIEDAIKFVSFVDEIKSSKSKVLVHCYAGCGRTGTLLAVYLVSQGMNANNAITHLRNINGCFVETEEQEEFVRRFENEISGHLYKKL